MQYIVCDTNVVSELRKRGSASMSMLGDYVKVISVVTAAELRAGAKYAHWGERKSAELEVIIRSYPSCR